MPGSAMDIVILVVGDETRSKSRLAKRLAQVVGASELEETHAGVQIFTSTSRPYSVIATTPFPLVEGGVLLKTARQWIAQNSLRRILFGKLVFLVCTITSSVSYHPTEADMSDVDKFESSSVSYGPTETDVHRFRWLALLGVIFKEQKGGMKILVNTEHIDDSDIVLTYTKRLAKYALDWHGFGASNITYVNLSIVGESVVNWILEDSLQARHESRERKKGAMVPFLLKEVSDSSRNERFGPWCPERVILFGKSGSGKSTLAQMLTTGKLDPQSRVFPSSSSIRGETKTISHGEGRGWYVVDTPGFGEPSDEHSTIPTREAENRIKNFVKKIDGLYSHFLFVVHKDRIDKLEVRLWKFFVLLFGADISYHFSIVISNADCVWVEQNMSHLRNSFEGCSSFLCAEFPSIQTDDEDWESELQEVRLESLKEMENALAMLARNDTYCNFGEYSKTAILSRKCQLQPTLVGSTSGTEDVQQKAMGMAKRAYFEVYVKISRLTNVLTVDDGIALLPQ